jgi:hypothetical protein
MLTVALSALAFAGVAGAKDMDHGGSNFTLVSVDPESSTDDWGTTSIDTFETIDGTEIDGAWAGGHCV